MYARADPCLSVLLFAKRKLSLQHSGCFILWYRSLNQLETLTRDLTSAKIQAYKTNQQY